ncbi:MAG: YqjK-like family protein [Gammaproteobacteria bacterium]|uniref:YqjK-like family protein n=1 Tax=Rhodoferax sp. TaxID=50421 RepID=UPI00184C8DF9|nr:YqjK-like family protein [Rhodoferax sp.]MBU3899626.1 YqjK-like family protein [Gammaproteobacteria bacterium]MBA3056574.1 hypothetical protein [Rhodoferax sp.]MBU3998957.1 YqjK-like family protein [Gammaproteobacteria bacterium]MBU4018102.1 YqjK-like family protein [Gammaproteobacteria bacterium]MBU4080207.1 YqjK-like family protein [Gammaproteobacteria bacterium]
MNNDDLAMRQQRLLVRSEQLRLLLAEQAQALRRPLALADRVQSGLQWLYRNPQWPLGALALVILVRPRRALVWAGRLWWGWRAFKQARHWLNQHPLAKQLS